MNEFDRLFNEYFGNEDDNKPNFPSGLNLMNDLISKLNSGSFNFDGMSSEEAGLGETSEVRTFEKDGITYTESIWKTPMGEIRKLSSKTPIDMTDFLKGKFGGFGGFGNIEDVTPQEPLSLEEQLEEAKEDENYEECARLLELINKEKEEKREKIRVEKKKIREGKTMERLNKVLEEVEKLRKKSENKETGENLNNKGFPEDDEWNF
jgi:hypothetical protein